MLNNLLLAIATSVQILLVTAAVHNKNQQQHYPLQPQLENVIPNSYVIEFQQPISHFATKRHMLDKRSLFYEQLEYHNISYQIRHEYELINAVSLTFKTPKDASTFFDKALGVKKAWPVATVTKPKVFHAASDDKDNAIPSLFGFYNQTGINQIREELGLTGKGIKIGIIDTGLDYTHPAFGGCFGSDCRVAYGYDFVGDKYTGGNLPVPDDDPRDDCNGHGTHVAGIIGADDKEMGFTGVAPDATLGAYRIFGCVGSSSDDIIMKAMEKAYQDGMDVINLSLGDIGWPESPVSLLADELATKGMLVCAAAGNDGEKGMFEVGAPSLGHNALSIASVDNKKVLSHIMKVDKLTIGYTTENGSTFNISSAPVVFASDSFEPDSDACEPLSIDATDKVVVIGRGDCTFTQKITNAQNAGAVGVILYNNIPGTLTPSATGGTVRIDYGGISKDDAYKLYRYVKSDKEENKAMVKATFPEADQSLTVPTAGYISPFSSWGLGPDLSMKPDLSAPGGHIYSTFPIALGSYSTLSGTSMASPYVAGVIALLQEARGGNRAIDAAEIRTMLINNGHPFNIFNKSGELESVARQGSGLIDAYHAITSDTVVFPEQLRLNDIQHSAKDYKYSLIIRNNGRLPAEYTIDHIPAATAQGYPSRLKVSPALKDEISDNLHSLYPLKTPIMLSDKGDKAVIEIHDPTIYIDANAEANITVRIAPPDNYLKMAPSIYSGFITITKNNQRDDVKYVPYAGFTSNFKELPVLYINATMPRILMQRVTAFTPTVLLFQIAEASPLVTISAVDAENTDQVHGFVPGGYAAFVGRSSIEDHRDVFAITWFGNIATTPEQASVEPFLQRQQSIPNTEDVTDTDDTTDEDIIVDESSLPTVEDLDDIHMAKIGERLPTGLYRLRIAALRPFGDRDKEQDYDVWYSPEISIE